ncbi:DUF3152 domain-containing protein [Brachybacterium phenoliresistens]|uniref:DUF3152 domain-containing protein n=1 Tax=Brachybacterium phenoliresistens TaxID=396014 RepID=UPI0031E1E01F
MPSSRAPRPTLTLTRRGRLLRTAAVLAVLILVAATVIVRASGRGEDVAAPEDTAAVSLPAATASPTTAAAEPTAEMTARSGEIPSSGTVGDGSWTLAAPVPAAAGAGTVHTYALRVEGGTGLDADASAQEVAQILADERGWTAVEDVSFQQVADPEQAEFTISLASPPTVDRLCAPAQTHGRWSCRIGEDVVLNTDRWTLMTPTYDDLSAYRAYMVNHEVGHFLGHGHETCSGAGRAAPVMLQQSIDLGGCRPNPWPTADGAA